jgi:hypothetical protein
MSKSTWAALLPLAFIILGAILWKFVYKRDFTWAAISSPPKSMILIPLVLIVIAVVFFALTKK